MFDPEATIGTKMKVDYQPSAESHPFPHYRFEFNRFTHGTPVASRVVDYFGHHVDHQLTVQYFDLTQSFLNLNPQEKGLKILTNPDARQLAFHLVRELASSRLDDLTDFTQDEITMLTGQEAPTLQTVSPLTRSKPFWQEMVAEECIPEALDWFRWISEAQLPIVEHLVRLPADQICLRSIRIGHQPATKDSWQAEQRAIETVLYFYQRLGYSPAGKDLDFTMYLVSSMETARTHMAGFARDPAVAHWTNALGCNGFMVNSDQCSTFVFFESGRLRVVNDQLQKMINLGVTEAAVGHETTHLLDRSNIAKDNPNHAIHEGFAVAVQLGFSATKARDVLRQAFQFGYQITPEFIKNLFATANKRIHPSVNYGVAGAFYCYVFEALAQGLNPITAPRQFYNFHRLLAGSLRLYQTPGFSRLVGLNSRYFAQAISFKEDLPACLKYAMGNLEGFDYDQFMRDFCQFINHKKN